MGAPSRTLWKIGNKEKEVFHSGFAGWRSAGGVVVERTGFEPANPFRCRSIFISPYCWADDLKLYRLSAVRCYRRCYWNPLVYHETISSRYMRFERFRHPFILFRLDCCFSCIFTPFVFIFEKLCSLWLCGAAVLKPPRGFI